MELMCELCGERPATGMLQLVDIETGDEDPGVGPQVCDVCAREEIEEGNACPE